MTAAVREETQISLCVKREIDDYGLDPYKFRLYACISRRASNGGAWESLYKMARACCISLSRARTTWQLLNLAEITQ